MILETISELFGIASSVFGDGWVLALALLAFPLAKRYWKRVKENAVRFATLMWNALERILKKPKSWIYSPCSLVGSKRYARICHAVSWASLSKKRHGSKISSGAFSRSTMKVARQFEVALAWAANKKTIPI